jgi:hypothetical protein
LAGGSEEGGLGERREKREERREKREERGFLTSHF